MDILVLTPAGLLDLLSKIDELQGLELGITETLDGQALQIRIGDSVYDVAMEGEADVYTDDQVLIELDDANVQAYENLVDSGSIEFSDSEPVQTEADIESGILKEIAKTLLIGGMVRLVGREFKK